MLRPPCHAQLQPLSSWHATAKGERAALVRSCQRIHDQRRNLYSLISPPASRRRPASDGPKITKQPARLFQYRPSRSEVPEMSLRNAPADVSADLPVDTGLLPGTIIPPTSSSLTMLFSSPSDWLRLMYRLRKAQFRDLFSLIVYKTYKRPWLKLELSKTKPEAVMLHSLMNNAYCSGRMDTLREVCAGGLYEHLATKIENRGPSDVLEWQSDKSMPSKARIVSNRGARMPDGAGLRQAVVRIQSTQSLTRFTRGADGRLTPVAGSGAPRQMDEHVVIERRLHNGVERPWKIWGTVKPLSVEEILHDGTQTGGAEAAQARIDKANGTRSKDSLLPQSTSPT